MESKVKLIIENQADECIWSLEHNHVYTAGTSAKTNELISNNIPVYKTGRGGKYTYHGPGQRVIYLMLNLEKRAKSAAPDLRQYIFNLEELIIQTIAEFGIKGIRKTGMTGIWVRKNNQIAKIAAIGIRVKKWVTFHGIAINVYPDLNYYSGIVPCGISDYGVTSMHDLNINVCLNELDEALKEKFNKVFECVR